MELAPSILSADFAILKEQIREVEETGVRMIHLDVMDGHFVPNMTFGAVLVKSIRRYTDLIFDVHLMIDHPDRYIEDFVKAGADIITVHIECESDIDECIDMIHSYGIKAGIAVNPDTDIMLAEKYLGKTDMVLVMSVHPGFGGQTYVSDVESKIKYLRELSGVDFDIEIDGGISAENIAHVSDIGVDIVVTGSAVFNGDITGSVKALYEAAGEKL
ncbi:MAG: ribulose-phosphate 3-epimerase [Oscillospiraceae bacterium]|nr:ribulose-phosphate 3-epimerase [Oscillospiraceae bacterium]